jgi:glyoxylase-like metal-dependent hydrolase (beta-lactamase superfamily II)
MRIPTVLAATSLALAIASLPAAAAEVGFGPQVVTPEAYAFSVGQARAASLHDMRFVIPNDGKTLGLGEDPAVVAEVLRAAGAPTDRITLSVNALLVRSGQRVMLVDAGLGEAMKGALLASLQQAGVQPAQVTDVLLTHTHMDHAGGLLDAQGGLAFPNATIRLSANEWAWMQQKEGARAKVLAPKVETFEPGRPVAPGVTPVETYGHTPGHVGFEIVSGGGRLVAIGDVAHSSTVSLAKPGWSIQFDASDAEGRATRAAALARLAKSGDLVFSPHFPFPGVGRIVAKGEGYAWEPVRR